MNHRDPHSAPRRKTTWAFIGFAIVAGFFLLTEHRAHLLGVLPFLILLACPLLHMFHHSSHGGPRDRDDSGGASGGHRH